MRSLSPEVLDLLDEGRVAIRGMIRFDFSRTYGFWTGNANWLYNGVTYVPGGIINVSALPAQMGLIRPCRIANAIRHNQCHTMVS